MEFPDYYNDIEPIELSDELAMFLGAPNDGKYKIYYNEIVKMAGHSCATVAGAFLMAREGLKALYKNDTPRRGNIQVELRDSAEEGSVGVSAAVFTNITGAAGSTGFAGINSDYARRNLLSFNANIVGFVRFTRKDTGKSIELRYFPANLVHPGNIMMSAIGPQATEETKRTFPKRWSDMIGDIFANADKVIEIT